MKAKKKRGVEAPPTVKAFTNSVVNTPLDNIDVPLSRFSWDYEKGEFYHWVDLFNHFELFFERHVKPRKDLQLEGEFLEGDGPFPKGSVLQVLRVTRVILENCVNKYLYSSNEHVSLLFASTDPDVVIAALQTLAAFVKKPVQSNRAMQWHGDTTLNARLFSLSQGWGGKEEGLDLLAAAVDNGCDANACKLGATLYFEFYTESDSSSSHGETNPSGLRVIHIPDLQLRLEEDLQLLKQLVDQYGVPSNLRFSLLARIRFARAFANLSSRRQHIRIRLLAFTVLLQSNPDHEDLTAFFTNEPEFVDGLVTVLRYEDTVPEEIRLLAVLALAAQAQDRPRQSTVLNVISAGGLRGILPSLMQKAIGSITEGSRGCSVAFVEALLSLVTVLVSSSSGRAALREAGLIPTLLPLLKDMEPQHMDLVSAALHILEAFMDSSTPAGTLLRDLGGLGDTVARLKLEVTRVADGAKPEREESKVGTKGKAALYQSGYEDQSSQVTGHTETLIPYHQRLLIKALLRAIGLGTYAPGTHTRLHISEESDLPFCLCTIFRHSKEFGGGVFSLAASVMSDLIHKDLTCFAALDAAGLPAAFLDAITSGVLPSSEAVGCIPNSLDALCLNISGLQAVRDRNALGCFVKIFTSKVYVRALANDTLGSLSSGLDELLRHAPTLRGPGIDMCIEILKTIAAIGGAPVEPAVPVNAPDSTVVDAPVPMDTDVEERPSAAADYPSGASASLQQAQDSGADSNLETFLPECINNAVRLLETVLQNADTSRVFIEKKGIEALLQLYTLPNLPVSFGGSSTAHNMSVTFCAFSPQHSAALTRAVCGALKDHLQATLDQLKLLSGTKLSDLDTVEKNKVVRSLSAAECYLSLSSVLVRRSNPMMTKLTLVSAKVLMNIVTVHSEVLWQIVQIDDAKKEAEGGSSTTASVGVGTATREGEDVAEPYPVVWHVNIVHTRNGLSPHLGVESEFLPVLHLVLHASDGPHRRSRRDHAAEALTQIVRLGRFARQAYATHVDIEGVAGLSESPSATEVAKRKSRESMNYDLMTRLTAAARQLYVALGNAMFMPSRRRDDTVRLTPAAIKVAGILAALFRDSCISSGNPQGVFVICRYLGKVVEDMIGGVFDSKRRTCNTFLLNNLYGRGAIKELLKSFAAISQLLWTLLQCSGDSPMETVNGKSEAAKPEEKAVANSWLLDILCNYARLMELLVTSWLLLTPVPMAQLLIQPLDGLSKTLAKDPEAFVRSLQAEVLEVVLPVWNHPQFAQCGATFITLIASIIRNVYIGVGDAKAGSEGPFEEKSAPDNEDVDHEGSQVPVEDMLLTCMTLLQNTEAVAFPLADLLVTMCNQKKGQDRTQVISYLVRQLKSCKVDGSITDTCSLSTISHTLALVLSEDSMAREIAAENGIVSIVLDILEQFKRVKISLKNDIPKWLTTLLLVLDHMLVCKLKIFSDQHSGSATAATASNSMGVSSGTPAAAELFEAFNLQKETVVSPLVSVLGYMSEDEQRRAMSMATDFIQMQLPSATIQALLQLCAGLTKSYPIASGFFDSGGFAALLRLPQNFFFPGFDMVAAAIIRHLLEDPQTLEQAMEMEIRNTFIILSRHNGQVSPKLFLTATAPIMSRNPTIFMQAVSIVCQLETVGGCPTIVLAKEIKKVENIREKSRSVGSGLSTKGHKSGKIARGHHKDMPDRFSMVIDHLLHIILHYPSTTDPVHDLDMSECSAASANLVTFSLKLIADIILMYSSAVSVVLGRDLESSERSGPSQGGVEVVGHGGLLFHVLHRLLPYPGEKVNKEEWRGKLSDKAAYFVLAVCVRSEEGRRRVARVLTTALQKSSGVDSEDLNSLQSLSRKVQAFLDLVNSILSTYSPEQAAGFSQDMMEAGMVQALACTLETINLDHPNAANLVNSMLKVLEALTRTDSRTELAHGSDEVPPKKASEVSIEQPALAEIETRPDGLDDEIMDEEDEDEEDMDDDEGEDDGEEEDEDEEDMDDDEGEDDGEEEVEDEEDEDEDDMNGDGEGLLGERGLGGAPPLIDFTMYPAYLMGRWGGRTESRLSSWTGDGQSQAGTRAIEEQFIEQQFIEQLRLLAPSAEPVAVQFPAVAASAVARVPVAALNIVEGDDPRFPTPTAQNTMGEQPGEVAADPPSEGGVGSKGCDVTGRLDSGSAMVNQSSADVDVQLQDERSEPLARDTEANNQDRAGSGVTVGESLSLEVEIRSSDGHDEGDRHPGPEGLVAGVLQPSSGAERITSSSRRSEQGRDIDEDMEGTGTAGSHQEGGGSADERPANRNGEQEVAPTPASGAAQGSRDPVERPDTNMSSIDRSFLEADLRAEVWDPGAGLVVGRRPDALSSNSKMKEPEGKPLVDTAALKALLRFLRLAQPLEKGLLQRLLLNLCAHSVTRLTLFQLLLDMLRPEAERILTGGISADGAQSQRLFGCQWNVVYARSQMSDESPPLVSRRVLEILTYLARNHSAVANLLLYLEPLAHSASVSVDDFPQKVKEKGKAKIFDIPVDEKRTVKGESPLMLLLKLLKQPLYSRSSAHLEQVMGLLEVVTSNAGAEASRLDASGDATDPCEEDLGHSASGSGHKFNASAILANLPEPELRYLCKLLPQEGLSDTAYQLVAEVLKKLATAAPTHRRLFVAELAVAAGHLSSPAVDELDRLGDADTVALSTTSMAGAALLRVLQALSALTSSIGSVSEQDAGGEEREREDVLLVRDLSGGLEMLWQGLSVCVGKIEGRLGNSPALGAPSSSAFSPPAAVVGPGTGSVAPPLPQGTQKLLPFVEAFFVFCEKFMTGASQSGPNERQRHSQKALESESEKIMTFIGFADKHRRLLNAFVRQNPGLLEKSLCLLLRTPQSIDFDNKRAYFLSRIQQLHEQHYFPLRIRVRRAYLLEDSYNQLRMRTPDELKGRLTVRFKGEEGIDAGGLTREWYQLLSRATCDKNALLFTTVGNEYTFQPNPNSVYQTEHLSYFKFVGQVVAKALFDGQLLDVYFTRSFYKHILGVKVTYHDIEAIDSDYFKNLKWILENDISGIQELTFSMDADQEKHILYEQTEVTDFELIPGGREIVVTEENKHEYVDKVAEHRLTTAIRPQIESFMEGFNELVSRELISIFNDKELELLISGVPDIDLEDLKANTEYIGYTAASPVVQWFWDVVRSLSKEDMARLLQFTTGTSKVPLEGFRALQGFSDPQRFQIHKAYGAPERLPSAHTCFNQLDLPDYATKDQLQDRLLLAIHGASEGFGFR